MSKIKVSFKGKVSLSINKRDNKIIFKFLLKWGFPIILGISTTIINIIVNINKV